jgi:hypothetical protein
MVQLIVKLTILVGGSNIVLWIKLLKTKKKNTVRASSASPTDKISLISLDPYFYRLHLREFRLNC